MPMMLLAALMFAQAPAAAEPATAQPVKVKKQKPPQVCEYIEVTGSRAKRRVCRDAGGNLDLGPGVSNSAYGKARIEPQNAPTVGGPGGSH